MKEYMRVDEDEWATRTETQAKTLPEGWRWSDWDDGSGCLLNPKGESFFSYDRAPYINQGGVEYQVTEKQGWNVFWGGFADYKEYVEKTVNDILTLAGKNTPQTNHSPEMQM